MSKLVYLAGPIAGLEYEGATTWRDDISLELLALDYHPLSPMRGKEHLKHAGILEGTVSGDRYNNLMTTTKAIITRDRFDCTRADIVIFNLLGVAKVSIGTMIEMGWADSARIPSIVIIEPTGNIHEHCMVSELTGFRVSSVKEALYVLSRLN